MPSRRQGFTLVEMLVSVALVLLMMVLFAEIFQLAAEAMSRAKGMAENDQRVRTLAVLLRSDIESRTFRTVVPFAADEDPLAPDVPFNERKGYVYISENRLDSEIDDVLQLTVTTNVAALEDYPFKPDIDYPFFGKATMVGGDDTDPTEPEFDDGQVEIIAGTPPTQKALDNNTGASRYAEVCYFVRNGNLYRRMLLIREPYMSSGVQPTALSGSYTANSFWNDFDYSARFWEANNGPRFISHEDLNADTATGQFPLGKPFNRFGFDYSSGNPREYADASDTGTFFGRFTHEETSSVDFHYPGHSTDPDGDPLTPDDNPHSPLMTLSLNSNGVIDRFKGGARVGQDLLMSNVHAFDVKVWDEGAGGIGQFVDVGHALEDSAGNPIGDFHQSKNAHRVSGSEVYYGPRRDVQPSDNRVFDTWHPGVDFGSGNTPPPFRPLDSTTGDPKRLKAIQLVVRFIDPGSEQMRQVTLTIPLQ